MSFFGIDAVSGEVNMTDLSRTDGSNAPSSLLSAILSVQSAVPPRSSEVSHHRPKTSEPEAALAWSFINARSNHVDHSSGFHDIATSGHCWRPSVDDAANGRIASPCYVVLLGRGSDGSGISRTMSGQKYIPSSKDGGFMSTHAKRHGIIRVYTPKVCPSPFH